MFKIIKNNVVCCIPLVTCSLFKLLSTAALLHSVSFLSLYCPFPYSSRPISVLVFIQFCSVKLIIHSDHLRLSIFFTHPTTLQPVRVPFVKDDSYSGSSNVPGLQ